VNAVDRDRLLAELDAGIAEIAREWFRSEYEKAAGGAGADTERWHEALLRMFSRPEYARLVDQESPSTEVSGGEARRLDILRRKRLLSRVEGQKSLHVQLSAIRDKKETFERAAGTQNAALGLLRMADDRGRREEAWFRQAPLAESVELEVKSLLEKRNELARAAGRSDYAELAYHTHELSRLEFMSLCDELEQLTRPVYEQFLDHARESLGVETLEPWDLEFVLARIEPARDPSGDVIKELRGLGARLGIGDAHLPTLESTRAQVARVFPIDPPRDVRVLVRPAADHDDRDRVLREFGRGVFRMHLEVGGALQCFAPCYDLAMGEVFVELGAGAPGSGPFTTAEKAWRTWRNVLRVRRSLAASLFEMLAYERPEGDLHSLYSEVQEHYLGFPRHPERLWVVQDFLVGEPLTAPNYIMSRLIGAQVLQAVGRVDETTGVRLAENFWKDGARLSWQEKLRLSTGRSLDPEAFLIRNGIPDLS
jgi:hypothetical protein